MKIADLHCDLLSYLAKSPTRSPLDCESRCSIPLLIEGRVSFQTLAIFTEGKSGAFEEAKKQAELFCTLVNSTPSIEFMAAIENASSILADDEPIALLVERLDYFSKLLNPIIYISLTWNNENRFGGGAFEQTVGLKSDGKELMRSLHGQKIAIDVSHASDKLAFDILKLIDQERLNIPVMASHSNCRSIHYQERNLPDELIKEIILRKGLIGLNFVRHFIDHHDFSHICRHAEYILNKGGDHTLAFGADFFAAQDLPIERYRMHSSWYFDGFDTAASMPKALKMIETVTGPHLIEKVANRNVMDYISRVIV